MNIKSTIIGKDRVENNQVKPDKNETPFLSLRIKPGVKLWQVNVSTGEVTEAEYRDTKVEFGSKMVRKSLVIKEGYRYITAINRKNAIRKAILRSI